MRRRALRALSAAALVVCAACAASPHADRGILLVTPDGRVQARRPAGEAWRCLDRRLERQGAARLYSFVHCERPTSTGDLALELVDREMDAAEAIPAVQELCQRAYPELHRREHADARVAGVRAIAHQGRPGCEVTIDATDGSGEPVRIIERVFVAGVHVVHCTATAPPDVHVARRADVEGWCSGAVFAALQ